MNVPQDQITIQRFWMAVLVQFIREVSEGTIRMNRLRSDYRVLDGKWFGLEFAARDQPYKPRLVIPSTIPRMLEDWIFRKGLIDESDPVRGGYVFSMESGFSTGPVYRKIIPVVNQDAEGKLLEFVVAGCEVADEDALDIPLIRVTHQDKLPLGLAYIRDVAVALEIRELSREPETTSLPTGAFTQDLLMRLASQPADVQLSILPLPQEGKPKSPLFIAVFKQDNGLEEVARFLRPLTDYLFAWLRIMADLPADAVPPQEGNIVFQTSSGVRDAFFRIDLVDGDPVVSLMLKH